MRKPRKAGTWPVLPLRDTVVFPGARVPLVVGRPSSTEAVRLALGANREVLLVMQRDAAQREPGGRDLHQTGTIARIASETLQEDGHYKLVVEGLVRARVKSVVKEQVHLAARAEPRHDASRHAGRELRGEVAAALTEYLELSGEQGPASTRDLLRSGSLGAGCDALSAALPLDSVDRQELLELDDPADRAKRLASLLRREAEELHVDRSLGRQVRRQVERAQREYILTEKMKAIRKELGSGAGLADIESLEERIEAAELPAAVRELAQQELRRLEVMPAVSAEATVARSYLDWVLELPWKKRSRERRDMARAARILEEDHHGLEKVKERILELLAVRVLQGTRPHRGSILCLVGPPGVGKTSLGRSIARATGRRFVRLSLGGVRDEAEIRGHRRTYVGAYPGRILQGLRRAGTRNPVFLLDEIDKIASDFRGDPAAALLEVLDPEQNATFLDHYLDTGFDLSEVLFVCTANVLHSIPEALQDRLETIRIAGYSSPEKLAIASRFLLPRQLDETGLAADQLVVEDEALLALAEEWTREAGVRELDRWIASLARKAARRVVEDDKAKLAVRGPGQLRELLGAPPHRRSAAQREPQVGVATGLSVTRGGGQLLAVEATTLPGQGELTITGQLGDVMQESLRAAVTWVRSRSAELGLDVDDLKQRNVHVHVPEGAIPKDGPSAGITMATAVASALTGRAVRHDVAMTGEITLRGRVLPVGGLKEKLLAADRAGLREVMLPAGSDAELEEVPTDLLERVRVLEVETMDDVLEAALAPPPGERLRLENE